MSNISDTNDLCNLSQGFAFVRVVLDCQWRDSRANDTRGLRSYFYATKACKIGTCAAIAAGNLLALVIYSRLVRRGLDIQAHWYLLALALMETAQQLCLSVQNIDSLIKYTGDRPYIQVSSATTFIAWIHLARFAAAAGDGLYAARNYWVLLVVLNRCRTLSNWRRVHSNRHKTLWHKLRCPTLQALANLLFWVGGIVTWQLALNRVSYFMCDEGQSLQLLNSRDGRAYNWTVPDSEHAVQVVDQMDNCLSQAAASIVSYLHLCYFTMIVYVPFMAIVVCCVVTWHRIRSRRFPGRYIRVRNILIIISVTFACLETPILIIRMLNDVQELLNADGQQRDHHIRATEAAEVAEALSSLHSLAILVFYLFADPTFRKHACRLLRSPNSYPVSGSGADAWSPTSSRRSRSLRSRQSPGLELAEHR